MSVAAILKPTFGLSTGRCPAPRFARAKASVVSDAVIAARLLEAALRASTATVEINALAMDDAAAAGALRDEMAALLAGKDALVARLALEGARIMEA